ncbi:MAG: NINE protein [Bacteroidota bacterium]
MKKRDKNVAGILALFFGWLGVHRYYLGQNDWGLSYTLGASFVMFIKPLRILYIPFIMIVCMIDAITLFAMEKRDFDAKFNGIPRETRYNERDERQQRRQARRRPPQPVPNSRKNKETPNKRPARRASSRHNPFKKSGIAKFNDYDYAGAIGDFKKSLELAPNDIASHFNIACAYSLTEHSDLAFYHLDRAVSLGFKDFEKIKNHHALAFIRIQPGYDDFAENGFRLREKSQVQSEKQQEDLLNTQPDLLDQLKKLGELRNKGLLTELEFEQQKKKLLG